MQYRTHRQALLIGFVAALWLSGCPERSNPCDPDAADFIECPGQMVCIPGKGDVDAFCIDRFEASRPDARGDDPGSSSEAAVSSGGVQPWTNVDVDQARRACQDAGKVLCSLNQWELACRGIDSDEGGQNGCNLDGERINPTGTTINCASTFGVRDMLGNVSEWVAASERQLRGGTFTDSAMVSCRSTTEGAPPTRGGDIGFRCCSAGGDEPCSQNEPCGPGRQCFGRIEQGEGVCRSLCNPAHGGAACADGFNCRDFDGVGLCLRN